MSGCHIGDDLVADMTALCPPFEGGNWQSAHCQIAPSMAISLPFRLGPESLAQAATLPLTAHARAISAMLPSAAVGSVRLRWSRSVARFSSVSDMQ